MFLSLNENYSDLYKDGLSDGQRWTRYISHNHMSTVTEQNDFRLFSGGGRTSLQRLSGVTFFVRPTNDFTFINQRKTWRHVTGSTCWSRTWQTTLRSFVNGRCDRHYRWTGFSIDPELNDYIKIYEIYLILTDFISVF